MSTLRRQSLAAVFALTVLSSFALWAEPVINSFQSFITVESSSKLIVQEVINVTSDGQSIKHGIYRDFPTQYSSPNGQIIIQFRLLDTELDGEEIPNFKKDLSNGIRIYIGDRNHTLAPGNYTFKLTYSVQGELGYFKDHDELYWNVTGNGWGYPILNAKAVVRLPKNAFEHITAYTAYTGYQGSTGKDFQATLDKDDQTVVFETTQALSPSQGLTIVVGWKKGFVKEMSFLQSGNNLLLVIFAIGVLLVFIYYVWAWRNYGVDGPSRVIIPLYEPPEGYTPAALRYISKMGYDKKVLVSSIINLAVKGYLKISEVSGFFSSTYTLNKEPNFKGALSPEETILAQTLFSSGNSLELKQQEKLHTMETEFAENLSTNYEKKYFVLNKGYVGLGMLLSVMVLVALCIINPKVWPSIMIFLFLCPTTYVLTALSNDRTLQKIWSAVGLVLYVGFFIAIIYFILQPVLGPITAEIFCLMFLVLNILTGLFAYLLKRPTAAGQKLDEQIEGFKLFLNATEKDRLNFRNPPNLTPALFERYLPYALALGLEQQWAEKFTKILEQANFQPHWYVGSNAMAFNSLAFTSSLSNSFTSAVSASATAPGSSSGFSGGSSGGGGGGGGGGGW